MADHDQRLTALELRVAALLNRVTELEEPPNRKEVMSNEPVLTAASVSGAIVAIASLFNIGLDLGTVQTVVVAVLPIVFALIARQKVSPV